MFPGPISSCDTLQTMQKSASSVRSAIPRHARLATFGLALSLGVSALSIAGVVPKGTPLSLAPQHAKAASPPPGCSGSGAGWTIGGVGAGSAGACYPVLNPGTPSPGPGGTNSYASPAPSCPIGANTIWPYFAPDGASPTGWGWNVTGPDWVHANDYNDDYGIGDTWHGTTLGWNTDAAGFDDGGATPTAADDQLDLANGDPGDTANTTVYAANNVSNYRYSSFNYSGYADFNGFDPNQFAYGNYYGYLHIQPTPGGNAHMGSDLESQIQSVWDLAYQGVPGFITPEQDPLGYASTNPMWFDPSNPGSPYNPTSAPTDELHYVDGECYDTLPGNRTGMWDPGNSMAEFCNGCGPLSWSPTGNGPIDCCGFVATPPAGCSCVVPSPPPGSGAFTNINTDPGLIDTSPDPGKTTYINMPTCAWINGNNSAPPGGVVAHAGPIAVTGVGANGTSVTYWVWYVVQVVPSTNVVWNWGDGTTTQTTNDGQPTLGAPYKYDPATGSWSSTSPCGNSHAYTTYNPSRTITASQSFNYQLYATWGECPTGYGSCQNFYNMTPGCAGGAGIGTCWTSAGTVNWGGVNHEVDQAEAVPLVAQQTSVTPSATITGVSPTYVSKNGGVPITISGTGFQGSGVSVQDVQFDFTNSGCATPGSPGIYSAKTPVGTTSPAFTVNSSTSITAYIPSAPFIPTGSGCYADVRVVLNGGGGPAFTTAYTSADRLFVGTSSPPVITSVSPASGAVQGGQTVDIYGSWLSASSETVSFGSLPATIVSKTCTPSFTTQTSCDLKVTAPNDVPASGGTCAMASCPVNVTVFTAGGGPSTCSGSCTYTYNYLQPTVSSITPNSGSPSGGYSVTVNGTNLVGVTGVQFVGLSGSPSFSALGWSPVGSGGTQLTVTTPGPGYSLQTDVRVYTYSTASPSPISRPGDEFSFKSTPFVGLSANINPATVGQTVTYTASVSGSSGTPTGTVQFLDGGTVICSAVTLSGGSASCNYAASSSGLHTIRANYSGDVNYMPNSQTWGETIKYNTTMSIYGSPNPSTAPGVVYMTATLSPSSATGTITFVTNGVNMCGAVPVSGGSATCGNAFSAGSYNIVATYSGDANDTATSASYTQTVNNPPPYISLFHYSSCSYGCSSAYIGITFHNFSGYNVTCKFYLGGTYYTPDQTFFAGNGNNGYSWFYDGTPEWDTVNCGGYTASIWG